MRVKASGGSHVGVEKVNGRKVNGIHSKEESLHLEKGTMRVEEAVAGGGRDVPSHAFKLGRFVENRFVYRQTFVIRSYEIGPDKTATMETLMNLLQVSNAGPYPMKPKLCQPYDARCVKRESPLVSSCSYDIVSAGVLCCRRRL